MLTLTIEGRFKHACLNYGIAVALLYERLAFANGYGYIAVDDAPCTYEQVLAEVARCKARKDKPEWYRVFKGGSENTVFDKVELNYKFRYLHDHDHARMGFTFSPKDERALGHYWASRVYHLMRDKDTALIAELDTVGQTDHWVGHGQFPADQRTFVFERFKERVT